MKTLQRLILAAGLLAAALLTGCASVERSLNDLPQVSASELHLSTANPWGGVQIEAVNLQQTATQATADSLTIQVSVPFMGTTTVQVKGYVRDKRLPLAPPPAPED